VEQVIKKILSSPDFAPNIVVEKLFPASEGSYAPFPDGLDSQIASSLRDRGVSQIYTHQAEVWENVKKGINTVVVTPTASGKTLCYNLPVLDALIRDEKARALYLFPTKALSQDQQSELNELVQGDPRAGGDGHGAIPIKIATYDGDTPDSLRVSARDTGRIIISNPDMLHAGILPNHPKWIKFFSNLKFIVIDEAHAYRGVLGSHVADLIRRLKRVAAFYGSKPLFILCSATIGNPKELAETLTGEDVALVDKNGAPGGEKLVVLYNPPLVDAVQGIRRSVVTESRRWMLAFLKSGIKTILFAHSRIKTEVAATYVNEDLANIYTDNSRIRVEAYRGGLLPNERREIEKGLRDGSIRGVVSTNALELGIDIGGLDASVVAGFPGSFNSFWQQSGRAGRRGGCSVSVFVASSSPMDQFIMNDPEWFFGKSAEEARLDPNNPYILSDHVRCAAFELPFRDEDMEKGVEPFPAEAAVPVLEYLEEDGIVRHTAGIVPGGGRWHWSDRSFPAEGISLRSATADNVVIVDVTNGRNFVIGEMDRPSAKELIFDNAVYIHRGRQYLVEKLDIENRKCLVREAEVNYFTDGLVKTDIKVLTEDEYFTYGAEEKEYFTTEGCCPLDSLEIHGQEPKVVKEDFHIKTPCSSVYSVVNPHVCTGVLGDVLVRSQVAKFKKIRFHTHENIGYGDISLPEEEMQTRALVLLFGEETSAGRALAGMDIATAGMVLGGAGQLIKLIAPVYLLCDPRDLGVAERVRDPHFGVSALYIYDKYPGGTGLAESLAKKAGELFKHAHRVVERCPCKEGCPSCVGPGGHKKGTAGLLGALAK
jgi:DEAD/DEAH box helicase domain-containing protein